MTETSYEVIEAGPPPRSLLRISGDRNLVTSLEAFGPDCFDGAVAEMQKQYSHPQTGEIITFREPTTAESILIAHNYVMHDIYINGIRIIHTYILQLGRIVRTSEGVFANVPRDTQGNPIIDEQILKSLLKADKKVNGIWLLDNDFGYAPYETFKHGVQDAGDFAEGGLARILEHAEKTAEKLKEIASKEKYPKGVNVGGFDSDKTPVLRRVVGLDSCRGWSNALIVRGDGYAEEGYGSFGGYGGSVFGVLDSAEEKK